jgi:murein DD-endopeptidase MepM/ murein hydrolase activator NlpD
MRVKGQLTTWVDSDQLKSIVIPVLKIRRSFLLKPEITQKVKSILSLKKHRDEQANPTPAKIPTGNRRSRSSVVTLGLTLSMAISSFPVNCPGTLATAAEIAQQSSSTHSLSIAVPRPRNISIVRAKNRQRPTVLIAQSLPPQSATIATDNSQFGGEAFVPILVPAPKSQSYKPFNNAQPFSYNGGDSDSELYHPDDKPTGKTGETSIAFSWPAAGVLTSRYGRRWGRMHKGIDIAGPVGTPINSAADGVVVFAGWVEAYGNLVEVKHTDGTKTRYAHNSRLLVSVGQTVAQGQQVSEMGSTGRSTGSHLHFEIRPSGGDAVNPMSHLPTIV